MGRKRDAEAELNLPPGFRFHPTDEELVVHYLCRKMACLCLPAPIIVDIDLYKHNPWELPGKVRHRLGRETGTSSLLVTGSISTAPDLTGPQGRDTGRQLVQISRSQQRAATGLWASRKLWSSTPARRQEASRPIGSCTSTGWLMQAAAPTRAAWEKMQQQQETSLGETMVSVGETGSDSLRTPEFDVEHRVGLPYFDDLGYPSQASARMQASSFSKTTAGLQMAGESQKEDNQWFMDLKLDDLQSSYKNIRSMQMMDATNQDFVPPVPRPNHTDMQSMEVQQQ